MDDIDINALRSYRIEFEHRNPDHVWNVDDDMTFLKIMGGYVIERTTGKGWLTAAGLLMFGKGLSVRERFDNIGMDYIDERNARIQSIINCDSMRIGHILADLVEQQMLIADKKGRWTTYKINEDYKIQPEQFILLNDFTCRKT